MKLTRRAVTASGGALFVSTAAAWGATSDPGARRVLEAAVDAFFAGWASGDWTAFLDCCDETMTFQFPVGEQRGRHGPPEGKRAVTAWTAAHQAQDHGIDNRSQALRRRLGRRLRSRQRDNRWRALHWPACDLHASRPDGEAGRVSRIFRRDRRVNSGHHAINMKVRGRGVVAASMPLNARMIEQRISEARAQAG
ncbi:nuclear transport factor 2 family protein [Rhizobium sp. LARHSG275]